MKITPNIIEYFLIDATIFLDFSVISLFLPSILMKNNIKTRANRKDPIANILLIQRPSGINSFPQLYNKINNQILIQ
jgi:hypothetical protein